MLQIKLTAPYSFEGEEVEKPRPEEGQALLKVHSIGICGSDIQMWHGKHKYMTYPVVIGHEVSATVEEVGLGVKDFSVGDKVTVEPQIFCRKCQPCLMGRFNVCEKLEVMGVHRDGFCREYVALDTSYLHLCPADIKEEWRALMEPLAVGVGAVKRGTSSCGTNLCEYNPQGINVAVVGAGTIGNCAAQAARAMGAAGVLIADISALKLEFAERCGIEHCVDTTKVSLGDAIKKTFGPRGVDVIIDAVGVPASLSSILGAARRNSVVVVTGNFKEPFSLEVPVIQRQEISLVGHMMYVREDFADAIRFAGSGAVKLDNLITQRFPIASDPAADLKKAFEFIDAHPGQVMKAIVTF
ncbi:MAG: alcohol dehydrogenase catalytic domain-containing protein [Synergistaceae bacterium]|jgi:L-iditol 2-dehydrogenase|nr:alcohol dehydrogenase catalytic domain-containing protein [Synergistaceae bacterium]